MFVIPEGGGGVVELLAAFDEGFHEHRAPSFMNTLLWGVHETPCPRPTTASALERSTELTRSAMSKLLCLVGTSNIWASAE